MKKSKAYHLITCALFAALIAIGAFIRIPIPLLPFTLQFLFVNLAGLLLGGKYGFCSATVYLFMGLLGLPVFTQGGGPGYLLKPSFGYIIGFTVAAYVTGTIANKVTKPSYKRLLAASLSGMMIVYLFGMVYFYGISNFYLGTPIGLKTLLVSCFLLLVPSDIFICFVSAALAKRLIPIINK